MHNRKGFISVVITLSVLIVATSIGFTIVGISMRNLKKVRADSLSQSAYYTAEAGANYLIDKIKTEVENSEGVFGSSEEFFDNLEEKFASGDNVFDDFSKNKNNEPISHITLNQVGGSGDLRYYEVKSIGEIGGIERVFSTVINIEWDEEHPEDIGDVFIYGSNISNGVSKINGEGGTIIFTDMCRHTIHGDTKINVSNIYFGGPVTMGMGINSLGNAGTPGNIYINGGF